MSPSSDPAEAVPGSWIAGFLGSGFLDSGFPCPGLYRKSSRPILMQCFLVITSMV